MPTSSRFDPERSARLDAFLSSLFALPEGDRSAYARQHFAFIDEVTPFDVLGLRRFQNADAARVEAIREEAGKLVHLLRRGLVRHPWNRTIHPALVALRKENGDVTAAVLALAPLFAKLKDPQVRTALAARIRAFSTLERKFRKAELLLHPALDVHLPSPIPLKVLWALHDDIRAVVRTLAEALEAAVVDQDRLAVLVGRFHYDITGLVEKEELILYPAAADLLSIDAWDALGAEMPGFGFAFGADPVLVAAPLKTIRPMPGIFQSRTGRLDFDQLALVLGALPLELTFIDEQDVTRYYNDTRDKIFARTSQIIDRPVMNCHPEKVVKSVERMLAAFKAGTSSKAEMWIDLHGRFVHIVYVALRDAAGTYRGTLEIIQDATHLRSLEGTNQELTY